MLNDNKQTLSIVKPISNEVGLLPDVFAFRGSSKQLLTDTNKNTLQIRWCCSCEMECETTHTSTSYQGRAENSGDHGGNNEGNTGGSDNNTIYTIGQVGGGPPPPNGENLKGTDDKLPMHQSYFQCRAARDASFSDKAVEICAVPGLGNIVGGENPRIGSFDNQGPAIDLCFSGSRVMRGERWSIKT